MAEDEPVQFDAASSWSSSVPSQVSRNPPVMVRSWRSVTRATRGVIAAAWRGSRWASRSSRCKRPSAMAMPTSVDITLLVTEKLDRD
jgi:hypothetical protein